MVGIVGLPAKTYYPNDNRRIGKFVQSHSKCEQFILIDLIIQPILADNQVRPKALLSISAMIHSYCRNHPECQSEEAIRQAVTSIENRVGIACRSRDETEQNTILLALKALGNAGLIVSSSETLKKCYQVKSQVNLTVFKFIYSLLFI